MKMAQKIQSALYAGAFLFVLLITSTGFNSYAGEANRYIFIDGGAHVGETIAHFEKSELYLQHSWEMFSFEPNTDLIDCIPKRPNLVVIDKAIWTHDNGVDFSLADSIPASRIHTLEQYNILDTYKKVIKVKSIDFSKWLSSNFLLEDFILVKFDIGGAEYAVLNKMLQDGTINYIDELFIEWHVITPKEEIKTRIKIEDELYKLGIPITVKGTGGKTRGQWFEK